MDAKVKPPQRVDPRWCEAAAYPFRIELTTRMRDMDVGRHLNNLAVAGYFEDARVRFLMKVFGEHMFDAQRGTRTVIAQMSIVYLRDALFPAPLDCGVGFIELGNSSFRNISALFQDGQCVAVQDCVSVVTDGERPMAIPAYAREIMETLQVALT